jgi:16S rRNA (guanine527-N7)-methyltransferase
MNKEEFISKLKEINISLTEEQLQQLEEYYNLLIEWNNKINLTAITNKEDVYLKHFYDSLTLIKAIDLNKIDSLCDVGTGAGFPGLVLKICFPNLKVTLVDSLNKRILFLEYLIKKLNLKNISANHSRAEDFARNNRECYDIVTCRAVAKLNIISELCLPLVKINGYFIPMKANIEEEIKNIKFLNNLNAKIEKIITFKLPIENSIRNLIKITKLKETKKIYPRNFDKIINKSL